MKRGAKIVISNTLTESPWDNAVVAGGDLAATVNRLRAQPGGDMIAYGGGTLVRDLIAQGLLDELHLFVSPTAIGAGMPVFANLGAHQQLRLVAAKLSRAASARCTSSRSAREHVPPTASWRNERDANPPS